MSSKGGLSEQFCSFWLPVNSLMPDLLGIKMGGLLLRKDPGY